MLTYLAMEKKFYEVFTPASATVVVKKSKFIGETFSVKTEEEAAQCVAGVKKKYYDARHHCFAYCLGDENAIRSSDDGEPSGTAGRPILDVILGEGMLNTLVVVTRYFGGTLLGTGGLTHAYKDAAKEALDATEKLLRQKGVKCVASVGYDLLGKVENLIKEAGVVSLETQYSGDVTVSFLGDESDVNGIIKRIVELSANKAKIEVSNSIEYGLAGNRVIWLG